MNSPAMVAPKTELPDSKHERSQRRRKHFPVAFSCDGVNFHAAHGIDISTSGICILSEEPLLPKVAMRIWLGKHDAFIVDMQTMWSRPQMHEGKNWTRTGLKFRSFAGQKDLITCFVEDKPYKKGAALQKALDIVKADPKRAKEMLPKPLVDQFLDQLIKVERLAAGTAENPLVRYQYKGLRDRQGEPAHQMLIYSKLSSNEGSQSFVTLFIFDEEGDRVQMILQ